MQLNDKLSLDISDDTEMKEYLATKSSGDECSLTVTVSLDENTGDQAVFSVKDIEINSYRESEEAPADDESEEPSMPVMMIMGSKSKKGGGY
jgi:hypothetical protein